MDAVRSQVTVFGRRVETFTLTPRAAEPTRDPAAGLGPAHLVFLHGWGLTPRTYLPGLRRLAAAGHPVTALTLPGFGGSDPLRGAHQSLPGIAEHLGHTLDLLTDCGHLPARVGLVGHSFGGGVSLRLAAMRPTSTSTLSLICPAGGAAVARTNPAHAAVGLFRDAAAPWALRAILDMGHNLRRHPLALALSGLSAWQADLLADVDVVSGHGIETLLSFAEADTVVSRGTFHERVLPHIEVELVPGRHSWLLCQPARFADKVTGHLATAAARAAAGAPAA